MLNRNLVNEPERHLQSNDDYFLFWGNGVGDEALGYLISAETDIRRDLGMHVGRLTFPLFGQLEGMVRAGRILIPNASLCYFS